MTVKELIEQLQTMPQDRNVCFHDYLEGYLDVTLVQSGILGQTYCVLLEHDQ